MTTPTNSPESQDELRTLYDRCDVSNNRTDNPIGFEEFKAAILSNYLPKQSVLDAIGPMEPESIDDTYRGKSIQRPSYDGIERNILRSDMLRKLGLQTNEGGKQ
jgi:hypothetical protein